MQNVYIVDIIKEAVDKTSVKLLSSLQVIDASITGVHYLYGHAVEIRRRLQLKSEGDESKFQKYPIIALFGDFVEERLADGNIKAKIQIIIGHHSEHQKYNEDRYNNIFKPILHPIYCEFIKQLMNMPNVVIGYNYELKHQKIDRPHWGNPQQYGNDAYIFGDCLDAVEIRQLEITINPFYCENNLNKII